MNFAGQSVEKYKIYIFTAIINTPEPPLPPFIRVFEKDPPPPPPFPVFGKPCPPSVPELVGPTPHAPADPPFPPYPLTELLGL